MIDVQRQRIDYHDTLILTVDEEGVESLRGALAALRKANAIGAASIRVCEGSERLTVKFEAKAEREQREAEEAEKEAARKVERDRRAVEQQAEGGH